ncbi:MAG TPA: hypothetical protein VNX67_09215 [Solirubrobacteraceae bacterium]|nr:hypothetical protein [Solirubrobacteraceae bacterium]
MSRCCATGSNFDLHGQLEEAGSLIEPRNRADISDGVAGCLARAEGARALLDVVGWIDPIEAPTAVEVDVRQHHAALLRALRTRIALRAQRRGRPGSQRRGPRDRERASASSPTS